MASWSKRILEGACPCIPPSSFRTCGGPKAFTRMFKKCDGDTSSGALQRYILKAHQEFLYPRAIPFSKLSEETVCGFRAIRDWLENFNRRTGIHTNMRNGEADSADVK